MEAKNGGVECVPAVGLRVCEGALLRWRMMPINCSVDLVCASACAYTCACMGV